MTELRTEFSLQSPIQIVNQAIEEKGITDFYCLLSGGKDSMGVTHFMSRNFPDNFKGVIYTMTGMGISDSRHFVLGVANHFKWNLWFTWAKKNYVDWVLKYGFGGEGVHNRVMSMLKSMSWREFSEEREPNKMAFISGVRKKESKRRGKRIAYKQPIDRDWHQWYVKPFFYQNGLQMWDYIGRFDLKVSPVHDILNISGDCLCGCFADPKWELKLIEQNYPEMFSAIKWLEKRIQTHGTDYAKKFPTWGSGPSVDDIEAQESLEEFFETPMPQIDDLCGESCQVDYTTVEKEGSLK